MTTEPTPPPTATIPPDDPTRTLTVARPDSDQSQDEFVVLVGQSVATRTDPPPPLDPAGQDAFIARANALAPRFRTELLPPPATTR